MFKCYSVNCDDYLLLNPFRIEARLQYNEAQVKPRRGKNSFSLPSELKKWSPDQTAFDKSSLQGNRLEAHIQQPTFHFHCPSNRLLQTYKRHWACIQQSQRIKKEAESTDLPRALKLGPPCSRSTLETRSQPTKNCCTLLEPPFCVSFARLNCGRPSDEVAPAASR